MWGRRIGGMRVWGWEMGKMVRLSNCFEKGNFTLGNGTHRTGGTNHMMTNNE
jgi:hypothetical protein